MKQRITLLSFIFFLTLFSFGQRKELRVNRFDERSRIESHLKKFNRGEIKYDKGSLFNKKRGVFQNSRANSSKSISSPLVVKYGLDSEVTQSWNETSSQWINDSKTEYTYDTKGNLTQDIDYTWNVNSNQWVNDWKIEFIYDANGYLTQDIEYGFSEGQWVMLYNTEYTYDTNGNLIQDILYEMMDTQWEFVKGEYSYDTNGNLILFNGYGWDGNEWYIIYKVEYNYDIKGNLTQYIDYWWDYDTGILTYDSKTEYTYDTNGKLRYCIDYFYSCPLANWMNDWKTMYYYDTNGNLTQYIDYHWQGLDQWVNDWKAGFSYKNTYSFSDLILPFYYNNIETKIFFNHMMTNGIGYIWDGDLNEWSIANNFNFSYSEQNILSVSEIIEEQLKIYPNPVSNILTIKSEINPIDKVEIYSVLGKKIKTIDSDFENINTGDLSKGIYLLRIYTEKGIKVNKLIKK